MDLIDCNFLWNLTWFLDKLWEERKMDGQDFSVEVNPAAQSPHGCWTFSRIQPFFLFFFKLYSLQPCSGEPALKLLIFWQLVCTKVSWKRGEILAVRKVTAVNCFLLEDQQWLLSPEGKSMMKSKASKQDFVELDKTIAGQIEILYFVVVWENCGNKKKV